VSASLVFKIARREYLARVKSRAFVLMTVFVPAFLGMYAGGAAAGTTERISASPL
jgi:ABC-type Na+ efflux pump permease subunit